MCIALPRGDHQSPPVRRSRLDRLLSRLPEGLQMAIGALVLFVTLVVALFHRR